MVAVDHQCILLVAGSRLPIHLRIAAENCSRSRMLAADLWSRDRLADYSKGLCTKLSKINVPVAMGTIN